MFAGRSTQCWWSRLLHLGPFGNKEVTTMNTCHGVTESFFLGMQPLSDLDFQVWTRGSKSINLSRYCILSLLPLASFRISSVFTDQDSSLLPIYLSILSLGAPWSGNNSICPLYWACPIIIFVPIFGWLLTRKFTLFLDSIFLTDCVKSRFAMSCFQPWATENSWQGVAQLH